MIHISTIAGRLLILTGLCLPCLTALGQMSLEIGPSQGASGQYLVFEPTEWTQSIPVKVNTKGETKPYWVAISAPSAGGSRSLGGGHSQRLRYSLFSGTQRRSLSLDATGRGEQLLSGRGSRNAPSGGQTCTVVVPPQQVVPAGTYSDQLQVTLYEGTPGQFVQRDTKSFFFTVTVPAVADLSMVRQGEAFNRSSGTSRIDFGSMKKGAVQGLDLRVRSNTGYRVLFQSGNNGWMKTADGKSSIPYILQAEGKTVSLQDGRATFPIRRSALTPIQGDRFQMFTTLGETTGAMAGIYEDTIQITVINE